MIICGIKLTHDGAIALIDNNELKFCYEMEKLNNNLRYSEISNTSVIADILIQNGYSLESVDHFVIDGWAGLEDSFIETVHEKEKYSLKVAPYREKTLSEDVLKEYCFEGLKIKGEEFRYSSYLHVTNHIMSAYCTSPFAKKGENSYVLIWDGGMFPRLYYFDAITKGIKSLGKLFYLTGNIYSEFSLYFHPFKQEKPATGESLSVAGKLMAYIAKGNVNPLILADFDFVLTNHLEISLNYVEVFATKFIELAEGKGYRDEDILASFHSFLELKLIEGLKDKISGLPYQLENLCFAGGCALNIKWNSAIRETNLFKEVWVPPFPNDSGSAIGAACAAWTAHTGEIDLKWNVFSGPVFIQDEIPSNWLKFKCSVAELASLIHHSDEPVLLLDGPAELGPRALGNRSIISSASNPLAKGILNKVKNRESYRPVAPICLEEFAPFIFEPGSSDPYMLYDHFVKEEWLAKIPAICHLDKTARLQTVGEFDNPVVYELLKKYHQLSGIPVLCNTSANLNGSGFFPNLSSAVEWGKVNYIWSNNCLYVQSGYEIFSLQLEQYDQVKIDDQSVVIDF